MAEEQGVSLRPSDMGEGALIDNVDTVWDSVKFVSWDYMGKVATPVPAIELVLDCAEEGEQKQYYSMGNPQDWVPSSDGKRLIKVGKATVISGSARGSMLIKSAIEHGFPEDKIGDDITVLEGLECHMGRAPVPKRTGLTRAPREDGRTFDETILVVEEITKLPWEKKKPTKSTSAPKVATKKETKAAPKEEAPSGDVEEAATEFVMEMIGEMGSVTGKQLPTLAYQKRKDHPLRNQIVQLVYKPDFLENGPWNYEDGTCSMG